MRSGFNAEFVQRVRRCEYPNFLWDKLPVRGAEESILRLDHIQPVGRHHETIEVSPYRLGQDALMILDDWLEWLVLGSFSEENLLRGLREDLLELPGN